MLDVYLIDNPQQHLSCMSPDSKYISLIMYATELEIDLCNFLAIIANPISREIKQITIEAEVMAVDLSNSEDTAVEGPIIRIAMEDISISITHKINNQNNMALPAFYAVDLIIPLSIATRENMT